MHDGAYVELVDPMGGFAHSQNGSLAYVILPIKNELLLHLLLVLLGVLLPVVKGVVLLVL
jgi:hypothetical protein